MLLALYGSFFNSSVILTLVIIALPLVMGFFLLKKTTSLKGNLTIRDRVVFVLLGLVGLFTWSGLLLGPCLAIVIGFFPNRFSKKATLNTDILSNQING
jgi:hypothetical protein